MFTAKLFWNPCILSPKIPIFHELFRRLWMPFWLCNVSYITDKKYSKVSTSKRIFFLFVFSLERMIQREKERQSEVFHPGYNGQSWASLNLGAKSCLRASKTGAGAQAFRPTSAGFQAIREELDQNWNSQNSNWNTHGIQTPLVEA